MRRTALIPLIATIGFAIFTASGASAQGVPAAGEPGASRVIDGVTFYYDADGTPLYKDDPVHYTPARRFYYRNGGWVMARSGYGHQHSRYANTGLHKRRGQGGQAGQSNQTGQGVSIRNGGRNDPAAPREKSTASGQNTTAAKPDQAVRSAKAGTKTQAGRDGPVGQNGQRAASSKAGQTRQGAPSGKTGQAAQSASSGKSARSGASASGANSSSGKSRSGGAVGSGKSGGAGGKPGAGASRSGGSGGRRGPK